MWQNEAARRGEHEKMCDRDFEAELKKLNVPYPEEDLSVSRKNRQFLTNLSFIVADAWKLSDLVEYTIEVIDEKRPGALPDLGRVIHPGIDANRNCICVYMRKLAAQMASYGEGNCPRHLVVIRASQAGATLFTRLKALYRNKSLLRAQLQFEQLFTLVASREKPSQSPEMYRKHVSDLAEKFLADLTEYSESLEEYLGEIFERRKALRQQAETTAATLSEAVKEGVSPIRKTTEKTERKVDIVLVKQEETRKAVNRIDKRDKKAKKNARRRFGEEVQEAVFGYWERGQQNATLRREAGHHRVTHELVFNYYKSELMALGIRSAKDLKDCLGARSDRIRRSKKR